MVVGVLVVAFIVLHLLASTKRIYVLPAVPLFLLGVYYCIYYPRQILLFLVFATPLSFNFEDIGAFGGIGFYFPTEPFLLGLTILYVIRLLLGQGESAKFIRHPISIAIIAYLLWLVIAIFTSTMPVVSFKFLLAKAWFILVVYFMANRFFSSEKYIRRFLEFYIAALTIVIVYTIIGHASHGFNEETGHWIMTPFFKDHTSYGALLAMFFPMVVFHFFYYPSRSLKKGIYAALTVLFIFAIILSYTRAAWVSLVGALGVYVLIKLRIDYKVVLVGAGILVGFYFGFEDQIVHQLESNRQDSSDNLSEHVQSITNISSDASNLERLNRWNSALRMFEDKPIFGHGPGTYMFTYARYQKSADKTIISTNQGDGGNAHSEYLGPLAEAGIPGALTVVIVFVLSLTTGVRVYYKLNHNPYLKGVALSIVLGLVTYYLHGILNNFLDTDKASVPLWGMLSILVAIELYHIKNKGESLPEPTGN